MGKEYSAILKERGHSITKEMVAELMRDLGLCSIRQDAKSLYKKDQRQLKNTQSFSKASTPYDNSVVESFFSSLKREELYRKKYRSEKEFRTALDEWIDDLFIKDKLKEKQEQSSCSENNTEPRTEKERNRTECVESRRKPEIAIKRGRVLREGLDFHISASAFLLQNTRHVFPGFAFSCASGCALFHVPTDIGDFFDHKGNSLRPVPVKGIHYIYYGCNNPELSRLSISQSTGFRKSLYSRPCL